MSIVSPDIRFLLDLRWLQSLQDEVSRNSGTAVGIMDSQHVRYTAESNSSTLCRLIRSTEKGRKRCELSDAKGAEKAKSAARARESAPIYICHAGLVHFAAAVIVDGQHLGTVFGGQVFRQCPETTALEHFRYLAQELDLPERADELTDAAMQIPVLSEERIRSAANLVNLTASSLSQIAFQKWQADRQSQVRQSLMEITSATTLESLLAIVINDLRVALGAEHASLFLRDSRGFFVLRATNTPMPKKIGAAYFKPEEGLTGFVGATGLPLRVHNVQDLRELAGIDPRLRWAGKTKEGPPAQFLGVALKNRADGVIGVLRFASKAFGAQFTEEDEWLATAYAQEIFKAIERAELTSETAIDEDHAYDRYLQGPGRR